MTEAQIVAEMIKAKRNMLIATIGSGSKCAASAQLAKHQTLKAKNATRA
jgi:hypothetical protein